MKAIIKFAFAILGSVLSGCLNFETDIRWGDINLFKDTPAWDLICAIEKDNTRKIVRIISKNPELLNYQEPQYELTPLQRAVGKRKYKAAETLLKLGADPDVRLNNGWPLIFDAIEPEWGKGLENGDTRMLELLLHYGADPNIKEEFGPTSLESIKEDKSPLIKANGCFDTVDKSRLLVEFGADINFATRFGMTAANSALRYGNLENAYYLIVVKGAKITSPYYITKLESDDVDYDRPFYPVDDLLEMIYPLDSKEYIMKKEIIKAFETQGVNYSERKKNIPNKILDHIKALYPDNWEEYLDKY